MKMLKKKPNAMRVIFGSYPRLKKKKTGLNDLPVVPLA
jgi:hypothetical protein